MNIVYLIFGDKLINHIQANFSILSFLTQKKYIDSINVVTDNPKYYKNLSNQVNVIEIGEDNLKEWKGNHDFFWRVKIKAIELISNIYKNRHILYLDSDTFLYGDLGSLKEKLDNGCSFMHLNEGKLSNLVSKTEKKMWNQTRNREFGPVRIEENHCMWNAGVIGIPGDRTNELINKTLDICDAMLEHNVTRRLIEQFAFSITLSEFTQLLPAKEHIGHYWGNKEQWHNLITDFYLREYFSATSLDQKIQSIRLIDFSKIPVYVKISNTGRRLQKLVNKAFSVKNEKYVS